jgi:hypothetical protein
VEAHGERKEAGETVNRNKLSDGRNQKVIPTKSFER